MKVLTVFMFDLLLTAPSFSGGAVYKNKAVVIIIVVWKTVSLMNAKLFRGETVKLNSKMYLWKILYNLMQPLAEP